MFFSKKHIARSQRGAMFGLDARVALAIFGGLSVIAGAAVFSSVRETRVTSLIAEFDGISKAYINYTFDTGVDIPPESATGGFKNLYTNAANVLNAQPPYITRQTDLFPLYGGRYSLLRAQISNTNTESSWDSSTPGTCTGHAGSLVCGVWLQLTLVPCEIARDIDGRVDGVADATLGNFRMQSTCADGDQGTVHYLLSRMMG